MNSFWGSSIEICDCITNHKFIWNDLIGEIDIPVFRCFNILPSDTFSLLRGLWEWIPELSKAEAASEPEVLPTSSEPSQSNGQITATGDGTEGSSTNNDAQTEDTNTDTTLSLTD